MAQYLDKTGLTTLWNKIKNTFALKSHTHTKSQIKDFPTIPTVNNPTITINQGGTKKGSFSLNQSGATTINLTDNNTTYSAGTGLSLSNGAFSVKTGYTNSGKNYKVTTDSNGNLYVNVPWNNDTWRPVVDNLTTTDATKSLSANQGKVLKDLVDGKAASSHTHSYLPLSGGTMTGPISYQGTKAKYGMIKWIDNTADNYGNGIRIGGGGATIIGGGESADLPSLSGGDEVLYLMNDGNIDFYSNCQEGLSSAKHMTFDVYGTLNVPTNVVGSSNSNRLIFRHLDGQNCNNNYDLYLQYHQRNTKIYLNGTDYYIENGSYYNGTAAAANSVAWGNVSGRPSSLPASDVYSWAKASSKPSYTKSEVGLGNVDNTADANKSVKYATTAGSANSVAWGNVTGKPNILPYTPLNGGLLSASTTSTWGVQTGSEIASFYDDAGGGLKFRKNCPSNGKMSMIIDGTVYVNEGTNKVIDTSNLSMSLSNGVLTITYNV